ncbi:WD40 repeat-like protein, partial [Lizonia empirigonia]
DETVRVWEAKTGQLLHALQGHTNRVNSVAFSPTGDRLASASDDKTVWVWDAKTGRPLHTFEDTPWIESVAFSSDGSCLETNRGVMRLSLPAQSTSILVSQPSAQRILVAQRWLTADADEVLWIPADYLPSRTVTFGYRN